MDALTGSHLLLAFFISQAERIETMYETSFVTGVVGSSFLSVGDLSQYKTLTICIDLPHFHFFDTVRGGVGILVVQQGL
jgi:hypothetical protein